MMQWKDWRKNDAAVPLRRGCPLDGCVTAKLLLCHHCLAACVRQGAVVVAAFYF